MNYKISLRSELCSHLSRNVNIIYLM